jgi:Sigma-70, region 4
MSYEEIAEITEVSLGTVKSRLTRGRQALKERLKMFVSEFGPELGLEPPHERPKLQSRGLSSCDEGGGFEVAS